MYTSLDLSQELFNEPSLFLKAGHLSGSAFCWVDIDLPEQAVGWFPLGLGLVMEDAFMHPHPGPTLCIIPNSWICFTIGYCNIIVAMAV